MMFVLKSLNASRVNLLQNDFAAGLPSPLSYLGLADRLMRELGLDPWRARTLPVMHRVSVSQGRTKPEMEPKGGTFTPIEIMEDLTGNVDVSVIIDLPGCDSESEVRRAMTGRRIAGGLIRNDDIVVEKVTPDGSVFRQLKRGFAMVRPDPDRPERLRISTGDTEGLSAIAHTLFPVDREPGFGWIVPIAAGYRLIEDPELAPKRAGSRSHEVPHVFAEPVLGIAELISVRNSQLTSLTEESLRAILWLWDARNDLVLGHPDYHPKTHPKETLSHV